MRPINTIVFDLCDALVPGKFAGIVEPLAERLDIAREAVVPAFSIPAAKDALLGKASEEDYLRKVIDLSGWNISVEKLGQFIHSLFRRAHPEARAIAEELALQYRMVLVSDIWREAADDILEIHPFLREVFPVRIFSFENDFLKHDPDAFQGVLSKHGIDPTSSLLIDDSERNVAAARAFGMSSLYFQGAPTLRSELISMNLLTPSIGKPLNSSPSVSFMK